MIGRPAAAAAVRTAAVAALGALLAVLAPAEAVPQAQQRQTVPRLVFEAWAGASSPKGDLGDLSDDGQLFGFALGFRATPRMAVRLERTIQNFERGGAPETLGGERGPDIDLRHDLATVAVELTRPGVVPWEVVVRGGVGATRLEATDTDRPEPFESVEVTLATGIDVGHALSRHATLFYRAEGYLLFGDAEDPGTPRIGTETVLVHGGGLRLSF